MADDLVWAYCVLRAGEPAPAGPAGVAGAPVERVEADGLAAVVSRVARAEFGEEPLRRNLNDLDWLERVARAHEAVLEPAVAATTIVPLRLCTLYESEDGVREMLTAERDRLAGALERLSGRQEWGVKLIVDPERLTAAPDNVPAGTSSQPEGAGAAYLERRRAERQARETAHALAARIADDVHTRLRDEAIDAVTLPAQNRELSGHEGEMLLNGAYLVETGRAEDLRALVAELEERHGDFGARVELTGPWPPYNFAGA